MFSSSTWEPPKREWPLGPDPVLVRILLTCSRKLTDAILWQGAWPSVSFWGPESLRADRVVQARRRPEVTMVRTQGSTEIDTCSAGRVSA